MMEIIILVLMMFVLFKVTGFLFSIVGKVLGLVFGIIGYVLIGVLFSIVGKVLGLVFGIIGYVLIGVLSVAAFGMAIIFLPIIVILGIVGIGALAGSVA